MHRQIDCFKAYDIRGQVPGTLDEDIAWRIGRAYAAHLNPKSVVIGRDMRASSDALSDALARGLTESGVAVSDIGLCGTEEIYFACFDGGFDGGIMVTASHNPPDYNGMKLVREGARPLSRDTGLEDIRRLAEAGDFPAATAQPGTRQPYDSRAAYIQHLLSYVDPEQLPRLKIVVNPGNGTAGAVLDALEPLLPFEFIKLHYDPDGSFPNGVPNPLLPENRAPTTEAILETGADLGLAWDGDFDRCFAFDHKGRFIEGYYIVGLLASAFLAKDSGARIVHDPRLVWNTVDVVSNAGGTAVQTKAGHAFIKERMRAEDAVYGGEMSAHHYFRDFAYADSGMIPWLLIAEIMGRSGQTLAALVDERIAKFPASGEINRRVTDAAAVIDAIGKRYRVGALSEESVDGLSLTFTDWRFNLRASNTEPLLRLNVESRGDVALMQEKTAELLAAIDAQA
ncbi:MAG: phosphomannomutase [Pseudomonadota bacterium]